MRYLRYLVLLSIFALPAASAHARVVVGIGVGVGPGYGWVGPAPVCPWGYYSYYPYACAPYGYYGPSWFADGLFIGAGPWFNGFRPVGFVPRPFFRRPVPFRGRFVHPVSARGFRGGPMTTRGGFHGRAFNGGFHGGGFHGGSMHSGGFRGGFQGGGFHGGGMHGGGGFRGR